MALLSNIITPSNVLKDSDIGTSVQAYDADTTKNDVANTFTAKQTSVAVNDYDPAIEILSNTSATNWARLDIKNQNVTEPLIIYQNEEGTGVFRTNGEYPVQIQTNGTTKMTVTSTGSVGIGTASPSYKLDVSGIARATSFLETVVAVTGTTPAISANSGNIQTWTLSGNSTPTDSLAAGQSVTLMIDDGSAYTITWTSLVDQWIGGSAPTLATTGYTVVELWKVAGVTYAAYVGDLS